MRDLPGQLMDVLKNFPGVGEKSARRMAFFVLQQPQEWVDRFADVLVSARSSVMSCSVCGMLTDSDPCSVCGDMGRDRTVICVVESAEDGLSFENAGVFGGVYHVLGGRESPLDGERVPHDSLSRLRRRIEDGEVEEVIMATSPRVEGDLTAYAVQEAIEGLDVRITRLACGLQVGGSIGYADKVTLHVAMESRQTMSR